MTASVCRTRSSEVFLLTPPWANVRRRPLHLALWQPARPRRFGKVTQAVVELWAWPLTYGGAGTAMAKTV